MSKILVFTKTNDSDLPIRLDINSVLIEVSKSNEVYIYDNKKCRLIYFNQNKFKDFKLKLPFSSKLYFLYNYISFIYFLLINKNKYDYIQINYVREEFLLNPFLLKRVAKKIIIQVYGSDFYVRNIINNNFHSLYNYAEKINFTNPTMLNKFNDYYNGKHKDKLGIIDLPFLHFDLYDNFTFENKNDAKKSLQIIEDKFVLAIGTNTYELEQHEQIIEELKKLDQKERFHLIFNLSYHGEKPVRVAYLKKIILENLKPFSISIFEGFQTFEDVAKIRLATDCLINLRKTDQLVLSMLESNLSYANVITGSWLPYQDYLKNVKTNVLNTFNELNRNIEDVIIFRKSSEAKIILEKNRNTILNRYSVEKSLDQWNSLYK
ncbi:MAG: hypothetical protein ACOVQ2_06385 [Flavobacterium sp.]